MIRLAFAALCLVALAVPAEARCHDRSHVLGYAHCQRFGGWWSRDSDVTRLHIDEGWLHEVFTPRPFTVTDGTAVRTSGGVTGARPRVVGNGASIRWLGGGPVLYGGLEYSELFFGSPGVPGLSTVAGGALAPLGVLGAHASVWLIALAAEVAAGPRIAMFEYCSASTGTSCSRATTGVTQVEAVIDARASAELFFRPTWSVGVMVGQNALDKGDRSVSVFVSIHIRPFDGMY